MLARALETAIRPSLSRTSHFETRVRDALKSLRWKCVVTASSHHSAVVSWRCASPLIYRPLGARQLSAPPWHFKISCVRYLPRLAVYARVPGSLESTPSFSSSPMIINEVPGGHGLAHDLRRQRPSLRCVLSFFCFGAPVGSQPASQ